MKLVSGKYKHWLRMRFQFHSGIIAFKTFSWLIALVNLSPVHCSTLSCKERNWTQRLASRLLTSYPKSLLLKNRNPFPSKNTKILLLSTVDSR